MGNVHLAIIGKIGLGRSMRPIKRFGIAAASNCLMAFQNEPRFMAACKLSKVFSSDGSITASRFMPTLEIRLIRGLILAQPLLFCPIERCAPFLKRSTIGRLKRQPKLPSDHSVLRDSGSMQTKLPLNGTIQHPDLAEALRGESGTFFCQQGGQGYIVTAAEGFSIKSLRPVGRKIVEASVPMQATPEPWAITKISEDVLEFSAVPQSPRQQRAA